MVTVTTMLVIKVATRAPLQGILATENHSEIRMSLCMNGTKNLMQIQKRKGRICSVQEYKEFKQ